MRYEAAEGKEVADMQESLRTILPASLRKVVELLPGHAVQALEEIRIRADRPLEIAFGGASVFVTAGGRPTSDVRTAYKPSREECRQLLDLATNHSVYSYEEELRRGYITVIGGHRIGLAGRTVLEEGRIKVIRDIACFNIRVAREMIGSGGAVLGQLLDPESRSIHSTLIISPPQFGKTTLARDLARLISEGSWPEQRYGDGRKVGIVDERSELAACVKGVPSFDVGPRTDVLDCCPKAEGMMMMIRSMSPEVLVVDEIGRPEDSESLIEALRCGVRIIATAHGSDIADIRARPALRRIHALGLFARYVVLAGRGGQRSAAVYDANGKPIGSVPLRSIAGGVPAW
jgi:stage III sporulation protein AA